MDQFSSVIVFVKNHDQQLVQLEQMNNLVLLYHETIR